MKTSAPLNKKSVVFPVLSGTKDEKFISVFPSGLFLYLFVMSRESALKVSLPLLLKTKNKEKIIPIRCPTKIGLLLSKYSNREREINKITNPRIVKKTNQKTRAAR
ncbi:MAG: hypothetical protein A2359_01795 [Candidatus Moranbacteria bacterium RIFOXYB1_FULL_43_19]|nr:MAG: hypothetical protein A2359_01795 [Candidatus Moranbacteria bacterium RIFOXYB1_FULL_43_19]OGI33063.1 MAG: hypothetical protein A2420_04570 [Candidatus Moranbacteria bacterium RIFOXYC1_FULL_44_13]